MERLHWVQHRCQQLLDGDSRRGWYSAPDGFPNKSPFEAHNSPQKAPGKQRMVLAHHGPHQEEYEAISKTFKDNAIRTTKYSLLTFIPMNLFQQFHRAANLYFLFLALLNWVPVVGAFQKEITMIPLLVVLTVIAVKDALEDYRRYLFDKKVNNNTVQVFCGNQKAYVEQRWKDVRVGDFVRLSCNEIIPADMLLLHSSDPHGVCYIETANLDGETNLKQRQVVLDLPMQGGDMTLESFHSRIECENPNNDLNRFRGYMEHPNGVRVGLHNRNLLLRSCTIRNTETVVGIVVYAGKGKSEDTKDQTVSMKELKSELQSNFDKLRSDFDKLRSDFDKKLEEKLKPVLDALEEMNVKMKKVQKDMEEKDQRTVVLGQGQQRMEDLEQSIRINDVIITRIQIKPSNYKNAVDSADIESLEQQVSSQVRDLEITMDPDQIETDEIQQS